MSNQVLSFPQVAQLLGVSVPTLYRWLKAGTFPKPIRLGPARVGYVTSDIDAWIAERQAQACDRSTFRESKR
jgi:prophage regulatory protein